MKILVFGAGMMGRAAVHDLALAPGVDEVIVADSDFHRAAELADLAGPRVRAESVDVRDESRVKELMSGCDSALSRVDYYDESTSLTAMMRTTGFSASIVALMLARGEIEVKGVVPQELAVDAERFVEELRKRQIRISETEVV